MRPGKLASRRRAGQIVLMSTSRFNRRQFLGAASATLAASALGGSGYAQDASKEKVYRVGLIGCGWYGKSDVLRLIQVAPVEVTKICDPDENMLAGAAEIISQRQSSGRKPQPFSDYRKMLADRDLDIVLIGSPDHWHALQMIDAVKAGAHVYVQKPISVDVMEGEAMVARRKTIRSRGTGRHPAQEYAAPGRSEEEHRRGGPARRHRSRGDLLLLPHARQRQSAGGAGARLPRLRDLDRSGAASPLRWPAASPLVADFPRVWQRDHRRHVHSHAGHGALDARPRLATAYRLHGRDLRADRRQVEHLRHADRHLRIPGLLRRLATPHLGTCSRPGLPLGLDALR